MQYASRISLPDRPGAFAAVATALGAAGVVVEALSSHPPTGDQTATALAASVAEAPLDPLPTLVGGLPAVFAADWAMAVEDSPEGLRVMAASGGAPPCPAGLRPPFLPVRSATRTPQASWMPSEWRAALPHRAEVASARLHTPSAAVVVARSVGPRFRVPELRRLDELARIAVAVASRVPLATA
ncbi:MAG: ACT domain-containing protein [Nitriliruptorales bacterium]|nr:ACT domain-containing protein [Nitriliruptorales bacterium]